MTGRRIIIGLTTAFTCLATAFGNSFEYRTWKNNEGQKFEARIDHLPNPKEIILQSKKGGRRYTLKQEVLSPDSQSILKELIADTKRQLNRTNRLTGELLFKGIALGLRKETEIAARGRRLVLRVDGFRISTDNQTATLELEGNIFATLKVSGKSEFFEKDDALMVRSSVKGQKYWWRTGINVGSSTITTKDATWTFSFSNEVSIRWGRVGVSEGPVISD